MADLKISQLTSLTGSSVASDDVLAIVDTGAVQTKKISVAELLSVGSAVGGAIVQQGDIGTAPNEVPLNQYLGDMAFQNKNQVVLNPVASADPNGIGDMVFQLTNNTTLVIKVKGSDGVIRSNTLTLA